MMGRFRSLLLQVKGRMVFGRRAIVFGNFTVANAKLVKIGADCHINHDVFILGRVGVNIGNGVVLSARCMLLDAGLDSHSLSSFERRLHVAKQINIGDGSGSERGRSSCPV